ncbi:hypothetical protein N7462_002566 [Penicillium macrosclerotiorum]|uniref:uncharacterized protein n=1 Tax=Penicillium macrosclerotiorum TaxID=303699 RepID=UPI002546E89F|nr:uncharacterized protein N7462_002566 [Penicillium macrosclerotiorum]KAJ5693143.1 hypothetical protein N7462_002566 [Penicillium macrosclerotiorum]
MPHSTGLSSPTITLDGKGIDAHVNVDFVSEPDAPTRFLDDHGLTLDALPYWLVNVPPSQWTAECPAFLRDQSPKNIQCLATPDAHYQRQNWEMASLCRVLGTNRIDRFQRVPSGLRKYLAYMAQIKAEYGSVMRFVLQERLGWGDGSPEGFQPRGRPFEFAEDMRVLYNDWPYGVDTDIVHLVVWTKFEFADDPATGDLTAEAREAIEQYVQRTFCSRVAPAQVVWFRNWKSLKSVHAVEHFHVMLYRPDLAFVREITHGDVPLIDRV